MGMCKDPKPLERCHTMSVRNVESPLKCLTACAWNVPKELSTITETVYSSGL